jgi:hypothetical protein
MTAPQLTRYIQGQGVVSGDQLNTFEQTCDNVVQLRALIGVTGMQVFIRGYVAPGDGGAGPFYWNATALGPDDGATVIVPQPGVPGAWLRLNISQTGVVAITNIASLRAFFGGGAVPVVWVEGYYTLADGGEGMFVYNPTDITSADNGGTIIIDAANHRYHRETQSFPISVKWFGAKGDGVTDDTIAIQNTLTYCMNSIQQARIAAGNYLCNSPITLTFPGGEWAFSMVGDGIDISTLNFPASNGLTINYVGLYNTSMICDMSIRGGGLGLYTGLTLNQTDTNLPNATSGSLNLLSNLSFYGNDTYFGTNYWKQCIQINSVSQINFENINCYSHGPFGGGFVSDGFGVGIVGTSTAVGVVYNFTNSNFTSIGTGITYGTQIQGLSITGCNFTGGNIGVDIPAGGGNLAELSVVNSQFNCANYGIRCLTPCGPVNLSNNLVYVGQSGGTGAAGFFISTNEITVITGNTFIGPGTTTNAFGVDIGSNPNNLANMISGNTFERLATGILLNAQSSLTNVQSNAYNGNTTNVSNLGTGNTVGGGSS